MIDLGMWCEIGYIGDNYHTIDEIILVVSALF